MRFKRNPTATIACVTSECLVSLVPAILMIYFFFIPEQIHELFSTLMIVPYFMLILNVVFLGISLIVSLFDKTKYCVNKESLIVQYKNNAKTIMYSEIALIVYDLGDIFPQFNRTPSQLRLYSENNKQILVIDNPSIIMTHVLRKKCKNANTYLEHNKRIMFLLILINGSVLLIGTLIKIFS